MTIDEAIEILNNIYMRGYKLTTRERYAAIKLGIDALKAIRALRAGTPGLNLSTLPGETEE